MPGPVRKALHFVAQTFAVLVLVLGATLVLTGFMSYFGGEPGEATAFSSVLFGVMLLVLPTGIWSGTRAIRQYRLSRIGSEPPAMPAQMASMMIVAIVSALLFIVSLGVYIVYVRG